MATKHLCKYASELLALQVLHKPVSLPLLLKTQGKIVVRNVQVTLPGLSRAFCHAELAEVFCREQSPMLSSFWELWAAKAGSPLALTCTVTCFLKFKSDANKATAIPQDTCSVLPQTPPLLARPLLSASRCHFSNRGIRPSKVSTHIHGTSSRQKTCFGS